MAVVEYEAAQDAAEVTEVTELERRARTLEAAALEIEMRGWCQATREKEDGRVCLVGGIAAGESGNVWMPHAYEFAHSLFPGLDSNPYEWNDVFGRTADDVTFLLRWRAAELRDGWDNGRSI